MGVRIRALSPDDTEAMLALDQWAFAFSTEDLDPGPAVDCFEWDRVHGAHLDGGAELAGIYAVYSVDLPVPGGQLPAAGLTWVGVHPAHRRRGVLTAMMREHLAQVRERGEAVSALNAAEQPIYGRFGYGMAGRQLSLTVPRGTAIRDVPAAEDLRIRIEKVDADRHADVVGDCYEAARRDRPGMVSRDRKPLRRVILEDQTWMREGAESLRILTAQDPAGEIRGYALFRRKPTWTAGSPDGTVHVRELVARDAAATRAMWGRLLDLDLMARVETGERPLDDELLHLLVDWRRSRPVLADGIWVRLVDLPAALRARDYLAAVDVVLEVTDRLCPWNAGHWRLTAGQGAARCEPTDTPADLSLDVRELGAAYLGSQTLRSLAAAGLVQVHDPQLLAAASAAFSWPVAAFCGWRF